MTIQRGQAWGEVVVRPPELTVAASNEELHALVNTARRLSLRCPRVGLVGGDLARTVAAAKSREQLLDASELLSLTVDVGRAEFDDREIWFISHAVIRRSGWRAWRGQLTALMNAQFIGTWDVAPRSHPNDGRLDVVATTGPFGLRQRLQARRRLNTGTHLPHPSLGESRIKDWRGDLGDGCVLLLDGVNYGRPTHVRITVEPDALTIYI